MKKETKKQVLTLVILFLFLGSTAAVAIISVIPGTQTSGNSVPQGVGALGSIHQHTDFKVYINNVPVDFSQPKYQLRNSYIHVEGGDGSLIHMHATGETIGFFFDTLGWSFNSTCLITDIGSYCNAGDKTLKFYVNNFTNSEFSNYHLKDLDKILVSYGNDINAQIDKQLASITDEAYFESRAAQQGTSTR